MIFLLHAKLIKYRFHALDIENSRFDDFLTFLVLEPLNVPSKSICGVLSVCFQCAERLVIDSRHGDWSFLSRVESGASKPFPRERSSFARNTLEGVAAKPEALIH